MMDDFPVTSDSLDAVVSALQRNEIVMEVDGSADSVPPRASKLGGDPWLPRDFTWPVFADTRDGVTRPLSFLCQINLADVKPWDAGGVLPDRGMLYFFYEGESFRWGFDPSDRGCARVFYFEDTEDFVPYQWPEGIDEMYVVPEMALCFRARPSFPSYEELECHADIDCDWDDYDALLEEMGADLDAEDHKLLGYADLIQGEMLTECERVCRGLSCGTPEDYRSTPQAVKDSIRAAAKDWTLLLQLSTLEKDGWEWMWGDCGMLYFYIRRQDLAAKRFENCWFSLQCG